MTTIDQLGSAQSTQCRAVLGWAGLGEYCAFHCEQSLRAVTEDLAAANITPKLTIHPSLETIDTEIKNSCLPSSIIVHHCDVLSYLGHYFGTRFRHTNVRFLGTI